MIDKPAPTAAVLDPTVQLLNVIELLVLVVLNTNRIPPPRES